MKNNSLPLFIGLLFLTLFTGCARIALNIITDKDIDEHVTQMEHKDLGKSVVFLPIVHIGEPEYYDGIRYMIDSLRASGYVTYYESIRADTTRTNRQELDTLIRKVRKITRVNIDGGYVNENNKSLPRVLRKSNKWMMQDYEYLGVNDSLGDKRVDYDIAELMDSVEYVNGEIILDDCDFNTPLNDKYQCPKHKGLPQNDLIHTFRNNRVAKEVMTSDDKKIIIIYGKDHANWICYKLKRTGFEFTRKGKVIY